MGDEDEPQEHEAGHVHEEEEQVDNDATCSSLSSCEKTKNNPLYLVQGRVRKPPAWMEDYVSGHELSKEENNLMMLSVFSDPMSFEEADKSQK